MLWENDAARHAMLGFSAGGGLCVARGGLVGCWREKLKNEGLGLNGTDACVRESGSKTLCRLGYKQEVSHSDVDDVSLRRPISIRNIACSLDSLEREFSLIVLYDTGENINQGVG